MSEIPDQPHLTTLAYVTQLRERIATLEKALLEILNVVSMDGDGFIRANLGSEADLERFTALVPMLDEANQQGPG